ncbi:MAG: hypothetical protein LDL13_04370 [Calditerrivibrio sp.]|nr:hypothetical protein [Calditerrivibrio sp.]MCA1932791.1 hypothetical protein [Calditerrivibrio sp.]
MIQWIKFAVQIFVAVYIIVAAFLYILPFAKFYIYKPTAEEIIKQRVDLSIEATVALLKQEGDGVGITLGDENILINRTEDNAEITISYKTVYKIPLTNKAFEYEHTISGIRKLKGA